MTADTIAVALAARALYRDGTQHIKDTVKFERLPEGLRRQWERKARVALDAVTAVRGHD